jgi:hypothetical protein
MAEVARVVLGALGGAVAGGILGMIYSSPTTIILGAVGGSLGGIIGAAKHAEM